MPEKNVTNGNNGYNWLNKFLEFSQKQVEYQIQNKNDLKEINKLSCDIKNFVNDIKNKLNRSITIISAILGIFALVWGYFSITIDNMLTLKIEEVRHEQQLNSEFKSIEYDEVRKMVNQAIEEVIQERSENRDNNNDINDKYNFRQDR